MSVPLASLALDPRMFVQPQAIYINFFQTKYINTDRSVQTYARLMVGFFFIKTFNTRRIEKPTELLQCDTHVIVVSTSQTGEEITALVNLVNLAQVLACETW